MDIADKIIDKLLLVFTMLIMFFLLTHGTVMFFVSPIWLGLLTILMALRIGVIGYIGYKWHNKYDYYCEQQDKNGIYNFDERMEILDELRPYELYFKFWVWTPKQHAKNKALFDKFWYQPKPKEI